MSRTIEPTVRRLAAPPDVLTLEEAAAVLRVGRSTAYREANAFERSGGRTGIPGTSTVTLPAEYAESPQRPLRHGAVEPVFR